MRHSKHAWHVHVRYVHAGHFFWVLLGVQTIIFGAGYECCDEQVILRDVVHDALTFGYDVQVTASVLLPVGVWQEHRFLPVPVEESFVQEFSQAVQRSNAATTQCARAQRCAGICCEFSQNSPCAVADEIDRVLAIAKKIGTQKGYCVTTMPQPSACSARGSLYLQVRLTDILQQRDAWYDANDSLNMSEVAREFIAGVLQELPGFVVLLHPTINSYKMLSPYYFEWSKQRESCTITAMHVATEGGQAVVTMCADACAPMHLLFAAIIKAGLKGMELHLAVRKHCDMSGCADHQMAIARGLHQGPASLEEALSLASESDFMRDWLGQAWEIFLERKRAELVAYNNAVTDWELEHYL